MSCPGVLTGVQPLKAENFWFPVHFIQKRLVFWIASRNTAQFWPECRHGRAFSCRPDLGLGAHRSIFSLSCCPQILPVSPWNENANVVLSLIKVCWVLHLCCSLGPFWAIISLSLYCKICRALFITQQCSVESGMRNTFRACRPARCIMFLHDHHKTYKLRTFRSLIQCKVVQHETTAVSSQYFEIKIFWFKLPITMLL